MHLRPRDPLLAAARLVLGFSMAITLFIAVTCALAIPAVLIMQGWVAHELLGQGAPASAALGVAIVLLLVVIGAVLGFYFFRHLHRIVGTVGEGDPFVPANAGRLQAMGWIVLAVHVLVFPFSAAAHWVEGDANHVHADASISLGGLLLAIVLFVLARVFREGTRLREELEGTV